MLKQAASYFTWKKPQPQALERSTVKDLPTFDELPAFKSFSGCAWSVWGEDDELGTVNLLTEDLVKTAATEEIR